MTATTHRSRLDGRDLRIVPAAGATAEFVAELNAEHRAQQRGRSQGRLLRGLRAVFSRPRRRAHRGRLRTGISLAVLCGVALSVYLLNADSALTPGGSGSEAIGSSSVASADCPKIEIRFFPDIDPNEIPVIGDALSGLCDALSQVVEGIKENVLAPIGDGIASALHPNRFCFGSRVALDLEDPNQGINSLMTRGVDFVFGVDEANAGTTSTWSQYGIAGASWNTYYLDCFSADNLVNYAANFIFWVAKVFALVAILLFQQTFNNQIVDYFFVPQDGAPESSIDTIMGQLNTEIYVEFFAVAVIIAALVLLFNNVIRGQGSGAGGQVWDPSSQQFIQTGGTNVRGSGLSDAIGKIGIMVVVAAAAGLFVNYGSGFVRDANAATNDVGEVVLGALAGTDCKNSDGAAVSTTPYDCAAQTMYDALVFRPWAAGNIGELEVLGNERETEARRALAMRMLRQNAYDMAQSAEIANTATSAERRQELIDGKQNDRTAMVKEWGARFAAEDSEPAAEFDPNSWRPFSHVEVTQQDYWQHWTGNEAGQRIFLAGLALIAAFTLGLVTIAISVAYLVLQLMTIVLAMVAPIIFLIGLIPGFGYRLLLRWAELFIGLFIKRVALVVFIGILLAMLQIIFSLALPWWMQLALVIGVAMVGLAYRNQFTNWASSGMTGIGNAAGIATGGVAGALQARRSLKQARQGWDSSHGLAVNERIGVAGRSGYASLDRPYDADTGQTTSVTQGIPARAQTPTQQGLRTVSTGQTGTGQVTGKQRGRRRNGMAPQGRLPGATPVALPDNPQQVPVPGRRSAGYVYQPGGGSDNPDNGGNSVPQNSVTRRDNRREAVNT